MFNSNIECKVQRMQYTCVYIYMCTASPVISVPYQSSIFVTLVKLHWQMVITQVHTSPLGSLLVLYIL